MNVNVSEWHSHEVVVVIVVVMVKYLIHYPYQGEYRVTYLNFSCCSSHMIVLSDPAHTSKFWEHKVAKLCDSIYSVDRKKKHFVMNTEQILIA